VPMADMLTNTVGIVIFILIFTVLTAGGGKRLIEFPRERETKAKPLYVLCADNRALYVDFDGLAKRFEEPLRKPSGSLDAWRSWMASYNRRRLEEDGLVVTGEAELRPAKNFFGFYELHKTLDVSPRLGAGETVAEVRAPSSRLRAVLLRHQGGDYFVYMSVDPRSIEIFEAVASAASSLHLGSGWRPMAAGKALQFSLAGGGLGGVRPNETFTGR